MKIMHSLKKMYQAMNNKKIAIGDYKTKSKRHSKVIYSMVVLVVL
jgi:hypothetical protein